VRGVKVEGGPGFEPDGNAVVGPFGGVVGEVEEVSEGYFEGFDVADIDDPDAVCLPSIG